MDDSNAGSEQSGDYCAVVKFNGDCKKRKVSNSDKEAKTTKKSKDESVNSRIRRFQRIPIFIVDYHNDVLYFIYQCLASRHLPFQNNVLVHFDSHPDMVISTEIPASACFDRKAMLTNLSIENWIMPLCYVGHFNRIIWIKNSWCQQIPNGEYDFVIGNKDNEIRVDFPIDYFVSEGNYCSKDELKAPRNIDFQVYDAAGIDPLRFLSVENVNNFILDIDLDFFSTANPFLEIYKNAQCYEQLVEIFKYDKSFVSTDCVEVTNRRRRQLSSLKSIFEDLETRRHFEKLENPYPDIPADIYAKIKELEKNLRQHYKDDEIDWLLVFNSGCTSDSDGLPHHLSTPDEIDQYMMSFKGFLNNLPVAPVAVTIACSSEDDYCPKSQVRDIEKKVLSILNEVFGEKIHTVPIRYYKDDKWDIMKL